MQQVADSPLRPCHLRMQIKQSSSFPSSAKRHLAPETCKRRQMPFFSDSDSDHRLIWQTFVAIRSLKWHPKFHYYGESVTLLVQLLTKFQWTIVMCSLCVNCSAPEFPSGHPCHGQSARLLIWATNKHTNKLHGLSPRANYTDRVTAACRRSDCQLLRIKGATWSAWRIPTAVLSVF
jgi:hypothetical protein